MATKALFGLLTTAAASSFTPKTNVSELKEPDVQRKAICILDSQPNEVAKGVVNFS